MEIFCITGYRKKTSSSISTSGTTTSSKISSLSIKRIIDKLVYQQNRSSTTDTYLRIWRQFNKFLINLDKIPDTWENKTILFIGYKIDNGMKSNTAKSYISAIKRILQNDGYEWNENQILLNSLTRACKLVNDVVHTRLPISGTLLELILFEIQRHFRQLKQIYLEDLYMSLFSLAYYGLMRISEVTDSQHAMKAANIHIAKNKDKILIVLYSSKTHGKESRPQKIKITSNRSEKTGKYIHRNFCPFSLAKRYMTRRGDYDTEEEHFYIYRDGTPVSAENTRNILKLALTNLGLNPINYGFHSLRIGRCTELINFNYSISAVKLMGRWKSNVVYKYIRS